MRRACFTLLFIVVAAWSAACPKRAPAVLAPPLSPEERLRADGAALQARTEALLRQQDEMVWAHWTRGEPVDFSVTAAEEKALYTREAHDQIAALGDLTADALDARALEQLRLHFAGELLARAAAAQTAAAATAESKATLEVAGQTHPVRDLERLLARERNALRRQALQKEAAKAAEQLTPFLDARQARVREAAAGLGHEDVRSLAAAVRRTDLEVLAGYAEQVLDESADAFRALVDQQATRALRLPKDRVRLRDLPRMFRAPAVDEHFPKDALLSRTEATLKGLGLPEVLLENLRIEVGEEPSRSARPLALPVRVPNDVRLSVKPTSGVRAQAGYLHEVGHALHAAGTLQPRFALSKLGGGAVPEAFSQLFERRIHDPAWLRRQAKLEGEALSRYLAEQAAWELYLLRRTAAAVLYEHRRHAPGADETEVYREVLQKAWPVPVEDEDVAQHALAREELFASARLFEAQLLAHALETQLAQRFGHAWWESAEAGSWLRQLWAHGNALDARELAQAAGAELSPSGLVSQVLSALRPPVKEQEAPSPSSRAPPPAP